MAKVYLEANDSFELSSNATIFGATGSETVLINGTPDITLDPNVERVELSGDVADYTFEITGTIITVYSGGSAVVTFTSLNQVTDLVFADGAAELSLTGLNTATLGGTAIPTTAAAVVPAVIDDTDTSDTADVEPVLPTLSIADASVTEGDPGDTVQLTYTVTLSEAQASDVTFNFNTNTNGTADVVDDFVATAISPVTIAAGETSVEITVAVSPDNLEEGDETVEAVISNPSPGIAIAEGTAIGTIVDDDVQSFTLTAGTSSVQEGSTVVYTVTAFEPVTENTTVVFTVMPGDATAANQGTNYTNLNDFAQSTFNPQEVVMNAGETVVTFSLTTTNDGVTELPEIFSVSATVGDVDAGTVETTLLDGAQAGQTFTLTTGIDSGAAFTGTSQADKYIGILKTTDSTVTALDSLDGAAGTDELQISDLTGSVDIPGTFSVANIEQASVVSVGSLGIVNTTGWTGLQTLTTTSIGGIENLDAGASTVVTASDSAAAATTSTVDGGSNVNVTLTGLTNLVGSSLVVGGNTAAAGTVTTSTTGVYADGADIQLGNTVVTGGTSVNVTEATGITSAQHTAAATDANNFTITQGTVTVTGNASTTSVTVTQDAIVTKVNSTGTDGKIGVVAGAVTVNDVNAGSATAAGTITEVTLNHYGISTIDSSALTTVNLTGGSVVGGTLGIGRGALTAVPTDNTLALNVMGGNLGIITDSEAATPDDGFQIFNITGSTADTIIAGLTAADATHINVSGDQKVTVTILTAAGANTITSTNTEGFVISSTLDNDVTFTGGDGADGIKIGATTQDSTLGAGNDRLIVTSAVGTSGTVDGGIGTDILEVNGDVTQAAVFNAATIAALTGFETLAISANTGGNTFTFNPASGLPAGLQNNVLELGANTSLTVNGLATGATVSIEGTQTTGVTLGSTAAGGGADQMTLSVNSTSASIGLGTVLVPNIDILNIYGTNNDAGTNVVTVGSFVGNTDLETLNLSGAADFNITTGAAVVDTINNNSTGDVTYVATANTTAATYMGGSGVDTVTASALGDSISGNGDDDILTGAAGGDLLNGGDGNDTLNALAGDDTLLGGAGNDTLKSGTGVDSLTGGSGVDAFHLEGTLDAANQKTITDFVSGTDTLHIYDDATDLTETQVSAAAAQGLAGNDTTYVIEQSVGAAASLTTGGTETIADFTDVADVAAFLGERFTNNGVAEFAVIMGDGTTSYIYNVVDAGGDDALTGEVLLAGIITGDVYASDVTLVV